MRLRTFVQRVMWEGITGSDGTGFGGRGQKCVNKLVKTKDRLE